MLKKVPQAGRDLSNVLRSTVIEALFDLRRIDQQEAMQRPAAGKWCPLEIIGHLIDSATVNRQRFVQALLQESLVFPGYDADGWVKVQRYRYEDWYNMLDLWQHSNLLIGHLLYELPEDELLRPRKEHNFSELTLGYIADEAPDSLYHLMKDYVGHLEHHLQQLLPGFEPQVKGR